jgi:hypothetical protein
MTALAMHSVGQELLDVDGSETSRRILAAVADELVQLSDKSEALQLLFSRALQSGALDTAALVEIQTVDLVAQSLGELARFLTGYLETRERDGDQALPAAINRIVLGDLAQRIAAICAGANPHEVRAADNSIELF